MNESTCFKKKKKHKKMFKLLHIFHYKRPTNLIHYLHNTYNPDQNRQLKEKVDIEQYFSS